jgi:RNA-directed DNA polymerase
LHDDLMERVLESENMRQAWRRVKSNQGAPGIDGMRIEDFPEFARSNLPAIRQALREGSYRPQPVRRVTIPKPNGGERLLGIPTVMDRVIQQAIAQVLGPIFDPGFSDASFGDGCGKGTGRVHLSDRPRMRLKRCGRVSTLCSFTPLHYTLHYDS